MMNENDCILSVRGLDIRFNLRGRVLHAIRGIDLDLYRGEVLAVVGESGSGKSVFTKSFMGLLDTNGSITGGTIVTFYMYISKFFTPIQNLAEQFNWLQSALASSEKVFSIMDIQPKLVDAPDAIELTDVKLSLIHI